VVSCAECLLSGYEACVDNSAVFTISDSGFTCQAAGSGCSDQQTLLPAVTNFDTGAYMSEIMSCPIPTICGENNTFDIQPNKGFEVISMQTGYLNIM